ncbi:hypothetical protein CROQUDRAFT_650003 [Cronartium quercuum f. sp. fusiforme G11]|uniref:Nucleoporin Pom152 n=1 Tax=Cronartium quercuum f. sp. fusiforme G11 TaxID=708437 RepID=A0A9P6THX4_9BASI|nr:hypothetical protein CROQUDRAFT_650003 [Cronartium quercuum f. sp. fusiforme G11]
MSTSSESGLPPPLISPRFIDLPTQRLYLASFVGLIQSYKLFQFIEYWCFGTTSTSPLFNSLWLYWSSLDLILFAFLIPALRIPRLKFKPFQIFSIISLLVFTNWILAGNWSLTPSLITFLIPKSIKRLFDYQTAILEVKVRLQDVINPSSHILGKHTIHILPHSTAKLNPSSQCFCIIPSLSTSIASIPIVFNNSIPHLLQYSVTNFITGDKALYNLTHSQLHSLSKIKKPKKSLEDWIEDEENDWQITQTKPSTSSSSDVNQQFPLTFHQSKNQDQSILERTQQLYNLDIHHIGIIRLERVLDEDTMDIRIARTEALVVECPRASFTGSNPPSHHNLLLPSWATSDSPEPISHKCVDETENLGITVFGLPPLTLTYHRLLDNNERKLLKLEGISPSEFVTPLATADTTSLTDKLRISPRPEYGWAEAQTIDLPLNISLRTPGKHVYELDTLRDGCGHVYDFGAMRESGGSRRLMIESGQERVIDTKSVYVHPRSQVSFLGCGNTEDEPLRLLRGKSVPLRIHVQESSNAASEDSPWTIGIAYKPVPSLDPVDDERRAWNQNITFSESTKVIQATQPGTYELIGIDGKFCGGDILMPSSCLVLEQPPPTIDLNFSSITDQCSGEIGLKASFLLKGKPPFRLHYTISQLGRSIQTKIKTIQHARDEIVIQPDSPGHFEYNFIKLDDAYYDDIKILDKSIKQVVHPLAQARFLRGGKDENVWSCDGETVEAEVELKGAPPYTLVYQILGEKLQTVKDIESSYAVLNVSIPSQYVTKGGSFTLSLVSITDGNGCLRNLTVPDLNIEVHRTKPTAKFYSAIGDERKFVGREGELVRIPMRLTGNGPWSIEYAIEGSAHSSEKTVYNPNAHLEVSKAGRYELLAVHDQHCPGTVDSSSASFVVEWLPRPSIRLENQDQGVVLRPPVCEMVDDGVELDLTGSPPFSVRYDVLHKPFGKRGSSVEEKTVQLLKPHAILPLQTTDAGSYTYTITGLSDRTYPRPSDLKQSSLEIRQDVYALPSAALKTVGQITYCVDDSLAARGKKGVKVEVVGKAPFELEIEVVNELTQAAERFDLSLSSSSNMLSLPYTFRSASPHSVKLVSVRDSNGCKSILGDNVGSTAKVEVAEIASIKAVSNKPYFCVGERLEYLLKGSPPWLIKYEFNNKASSITIGSKDEPKFSRLANEPGLFKIVGIAHKEDLCVAKVKVEKVIRPIPRVKISSGRNFIEDLREGDQSEIVFSFEGTPPFAFTYTRSVPEDRPGAEGAGRILETHTVTDIQDYNYSIFAREEGTWSVTFIQDRFCSFPPGVGGSGEMIE